MHGSRIGQAGFGEMMPGAIAGVADSVQEEKNFMGHIFHHVYK